MQRLHGQETTFVGNTVTFKISAQSDDGMSSTRDELRERAVPVGTGWALDDPMATVNALQGLVVPHSDNGVLKTRNAGTDRRCYLERRVQSTVTGTQHCFLPVSDCQAFHKDTRRPELAPHCAPRDLEKASAVVRQFPCAVHDTVEDLFVDVEVG